LTTAIPSYYSWGGGFFFVFIVVGGGRVGTMRVGRAWRVRYSSRLVKKALIPVSTRLFIVL
ncbi:hypothetical protein AB3X35_13245, partial [Raoultella terrigena]|uniref:hypothetical protein n=1 Tax=Raoultella terrigena TaxID=577 RepID=UPI00349F3DC2